MKHLLKMEDLSKQEIIDILDLADQLKYEKKHGIEHHLLKGKTLGMIFSKSSTRTRVSFEVGMYELGGNAIFLSERDIQLGRGESIKDTARVLSRYLDGIMIRTYKQDDVEDLAKYGAIPIINGLTDYSHPCQVLADFMTIREKKGSFDNLKFCYIGDGNNMANSIIAGALKLNVPIAIACPDEYKPDMALVERLNKNGLFSITNNPKEAVKNVDVIFTDVWASMGQEAEQEKRKKDFKGFTIDKELLKIANKDAIVLHCLPAHKGEEITEEVFEKFADCIMDEAENRLHAQKAVMVKLLANK